ncbi:IS3 family transposase [Spiroplasma endosymbiont of Dioctria linearis]|uniref:IS3 family transposase n=1 Tax=Spiroplasma endosymbiont of Dioctria linearis TaxID=3066290 RepID=UPI00313BC0C3
MKDVLELFNLKRSYWLKYKNIYSQRLNKDKQITKLIQKIFIDSLCQYGYRRITADLKYEYSINISHWKVRRIMRENNIYSNYVIKNKKKAEKRIYKEKPKFSKDLINREFNLSRAENQIWYTDVTYLISKNGKRYLSTIIDENTRKVVDYKISLHNDNGLVMPNIIKAVKSVEEKFMSTEGLILHSDRGSQYTSGEYKIFTDKYGILTSMGETGVSYDNGLMEGWHSQLKKGTIHNNKECKEDINMYVEWVHKWIKWWNLECIKKIDRKEKEKPVW